jgi:hypothetical protein
MLTLADGYESRHLLWHSRRLWSLWDMINLMIGHYQACLKLIYQELSLADANLRATGDAGLEGRDKDRIRQNFQYLEKKAEEWGLETVVSRLERITFLCRPDQIFTRGEAIRQMQTLLEAYEDDTKFRYLYLYPEDKGKLFIRAQGDWADAIRVFPLLKGDIEAGLDCYALGHRLPCIFYMMRVMEVGVQRFGKKLGVSLTAKTATKLADLTWHQILDGLNPKLKAMPQKTAAQKAKYEKYAATQSYLYAVKDAWRNPTMHPRKAGYSETEALNIVNQCRAFMNELAAVVSPGQSS